MAFDPDSFLREEEDLQVSTIAPIQAFDPDQFLQEEDTFDPNQFIQEEEQQAFLDPTLTPLDQTTGAFDSFTDDFAPAGERGLSPDTGQEFTDEELLELQKNQQEFDHLPPEEREKSFGTLREETGREKFIRHVRPAAVATDAVLRGLTLDNVTLETFGAGLALTPDEEFASNVIEFLTNIVPIVGIEKAVGGLALKIPRFVKLAKESPKIAEFVKASGLGGVFGFAQKPKDEEDGLGARAKAAGKSAVLFPVAGEALRRAAPFVKKGAGKVKDFFDRTKLKPERAVPALEKELPGFIKKEVSEVAAVPPVAKAPIQEEFAQAVAKDVPKPVTPKAADDVVKAKIPKSEVPLKERQSLKTIIESEKTSEPVRAVLKEAPERLIKTKTLKQSVAKAEEVIGKNFDDAIRIAKEGSKDLTGDERVALAEMVSRRLQKEQPERINDIVEIITNTAKFETEAGRTASAARLWNRLSPTGAARAATREIERAGGQATPQGIGDIMKAATEIEGLRPGSNAFIKQVAILRAKIGEQIPVNTLSKIETIDTMMLLLNFKTPLRNIIGNAGFAGTDFTSDQFVAPLVDKAISGLRQILGKPAVRTKIFAPVKAAKETFKGFSKGGKEGLEDLRLGIDRAPNVNQFDLAVKGSVFKGKVGKFFEKALGATLRVPDRAFYTGGFRASMNNQIRAKKATGATLSDLKNSFSEMVEIAHADGLKKTFQDKNVVSELFQGIRKRFNRDKDFGVGSIIIKFPKTPGALIKRGIEYSPLGFVESAVLLAKNRKNFGFKEQKQLVESLSRGITGTAGLVGTGALLYKTGLLTSKKKFKGKTNREIDNAAGLMDYQLNLSAARRLVNSGFKPTPEVTDWREGDQLANWDFLQPMAIPVSIGANIAQNFNKEEGAVGQIAKGLFSPDAFLKSAETIARQPLVTGITRAIRGTEDDPLMGMKNTFTALPTRLIPTVIKHIALAVDPERKVVKNDKVLKEMFNRLKAGIPGQRGTLETQQGLFGEEEKILKGDVKSRIIQALFNPVIINSFGSKDPAKQEIIRLREATGLTPSVKSGVEKVTAKRFQIEDRKLTVEEARAHKKKTGQSMKDAVKRIIDLPVYKTLDDNQKITIINSALRRARSRGRAILINDLMVKELSNELSETKGK